MSKSDWGTREDWSEERVWTFDSFEERERKERRRRRRRRRREGGERLIMV